MQKITPSKDIKTAIVPFMGTIIILSVLWFGYQFFFGNRTKDQTAFLNQAATGLTLATPTPLYNNETLIPSAETDSDGDGLSDALETVYRTDPNNPDSDGDGYKDGTEVANGYDPLIKSPNDKIDRLSSKIDVTALAPANLPAGTPSLTESFVNQTGITPTQNKLDLNEEQLNQFINETNARGILPVILDSDIRVVNTSGKAAIVKYLDTLSAAKNLKLKTVTPDQITAAFKTLTTKNDPAPLDKIIADLQNNTAIFRAVDVPSEVVTLHKKYLGAVVALQDNTEALKKYQTDYVSVLVAASRIQGLREVFTEVGEEIKEIEKNYGIT